jgi:hypothetical protein
MGRVNPEEQAKRVATVVAMMQKAVKEGRKVKPDAVAQAIGVSAPTARKLIEAAERIVGTNAMAEMIVKKHREPGPAPKASTPPVTQEKPAKGKPGRKPKGVTQEDRDAAIAVEAEVVPPAKGGKLVALDGGKKGRKGAREPVEDKGHGSQTVALPAGVTSSGVPAELRDTPFEIPVQLVAITQRLNAMMDRAELDLQIMRTWVFGNPEGQRVPGMCEGCGEDYARAFPDRPMSMFGPAGTPTDVANMYKTFTSIVKEVTKALETHNDVQATFFTLQQLERFMDDTARAVRDVCPQHAQAIAAKIREYQMEYRSNGR